MYYVSSFVENINVFFLITINNHDNLLMLN